MHVGREGVDLVNWRLAVAFATIPVGILGGWLAFIAPDVPRWLIVLGGLASLVGALALIVLGLYAYVMIDAARPSLFSRKPRVHVTLTHREGAFVGQKRFRHHKVRYWIGFTLNHRLFFGLMLFDDPSYETLNEQPAD